MRVLQPEALQMDFRIAIGNVVVIAVGIKQEIRRIQHPHAVPRDGERRDDIETVEKCRVLVVAAVAVGVFVDRDSIEPADPVRRRRGNLVINGPPILVVADHLQSGRIGILKIFDHPHPAALVPIDKQRLSDVRLREDLFDFEIGRHAKGPQCLGGRERFRRGGIDRTVLRPRSPFSGARAWRRTRPGYPSRPRGRRRQLHAWELPAIRGGRKAGGKQQSDLQPEYQDASSTGNRVRSAG